MNVRKTNETSLGISQGSIRTCAGCRQEARKEEFERFVFEKTLGLLHDLRQKAPGRGIWVHPRRACLEKAAQGGFSRAMKERVEVGEPQAWVKSLVDGVSRRQEEALANGMRQNHLEVGQMRVQEAVKLDLVKVLVLAEDASEGTVLKFSSNADRKGIEMVRSFSGARLGRLMGREFVSVIGVKDQALGAKLVRDETRQRQMEADDG